MGKTKKSKISRGVVTFEEETIKKDNAADILSKLKGIEENESNNVVKDAVDVVKKKAKKSKNKEISDKKDEINKEKEEEKNVEKRKKRKKKVDENNKTSEEQPENKKKKKDSSDDTRDNTTDQENLPDSDLDEDKPDLENLKTDIANAQKQPTESKRSLKRKKHAKLLEDKKLKTELKSQQSALNYLSKWKHSRSDWKFEKLKQIWLQQHLFNSKWIPDEFWEVTLEYFGGSKGVIRKNVTDAALKVIEEAEKENEGDEKVEDDSEELEVKVQRARDVIQNL